MKFKGRVTDDSNSKPLVSDINLITARPTHAYYYSYLFII